MFKCIDNSIVHFHPYFKIVSFNKTNSAHFTKKTIFVSNLFLRVSYFLGFLRDLGFSSERF